MKRFGLRIVPIVWIHIMGAMFLLCGIGLYSLIDVLDMVIWKVIIVSFVLLLSLMGGVALFLGSYYCNIYEDFMEVRIFLIPFFQYKIRYVEIESVTTYRRLFKLLSISTKKGGRPYYYPMFRVSDRKFKEFIKILKSKQVKCDDNIIEY